VLYRRFGHGCEASGPIYNKKGIKTGEGANSVR
jgi:hypothetical protein